MKNVFGSVASLGKNILIRRKFLIFWFRSFFASDAILVYLPILIRPHTSDSKLFIDSIPPIQFREKKTDVDYKHHHLISTSFTGLKNKNHMLNISICHYNLSVLGKSRYHRSTRFFKYRKQTEPYVCIYYYTTEHHMYARVVVRSPISIF